MVRLYHTTLPESARKIQAEGFRCGPCLPGLDDIGCWLSFQPDQALDRPDLTLVLEVSDETAVRWREQYLDLELGHVCVPNEEINGKAVIVDCRPVRELIQDEAQQQSDERVERW